MFIRRGQATARLGAGLLLAIACAAAPAFVLTPPAAGDVTSCAEQAPTATANSPELGGDVTVSGDCFPPYESATIEIFMEGDQSTQVSKVETVDSSGSVAATFTPETAGTYTAVIEVNNETADTTFTVTEAEDPEDPPVEDPEDPPVEDPEDPPADEPTDEEPTEQEPTEDPTDEPTEDPTGEPTDEPTDEPTEDPTTDPTDPATTDPAPTEDATDPAPTDDPAPSAPVEEPDSTDAPTSGAPTTGGSGGGSDDSTDTGSDDPAADEDEHLPTGQSTNPFPSAEDEPAPSAAAGPSDSASPETAAPSASATNEFPASAPEYTEEQREVGALAVLMTSLFAHGVSEGEVGVSPAEAGLTDEDDADGSDQASGDGGDEASGGDSASGSGEELAETGAEVTVPAGLAGLALLSGAGLLWHQRRRQD